MNDLRKAAEKVLQENKPHGEFLEALDELRQALAQPEQEPVAGMFEEKLPDQNPPPWVQKYNACLPTSVDHEATEYTAPPKREWVGLEDEDVATVKNEFNRGALWAEQILKEKNS